MRVSVRVIVAAVSYAVVLGLFASIDFGDRGFHFAPDGAAQAATSAPKGVEGPAGEEGYDLRDLKLLTRCVGYIRNNYVDPSRIDARRMLVAALEEVQRGVPELLAEPSMRDTGQITSVRVTVDKTAQDFKLDKVDDLYEMTWKLRDIFDLVSRNLPPDVSRADIEYAAVNGLLSTLDPHSILLAPDMYADTKVGTVGRFGGLGIIISNRNGDLTIVTVLRDTPAWDAGVKKGDRIVQIGDESTVNMNLNDAVNRLRGEVDTKVTITIARDGWKEPRPFSITRREIKIESVQSTDLGQGVGYVRIKNFQSNTADDLESHLRKLEEAGSAKKGLVLDLRDDPGGLLDQAIKVSDAFLSSGTIVTTVAEGARTRDEKKATQAGTRAELPVVVLVNNGSASASEIVTGALKNNDRAVIVGDQTFGKGSVQVLYELQDELGREAALKLTIAQYLTPGDVSIQSVGVVPDIMTYPVTIAADEMDLFVTDKDLRGEKDLDNHLDSLRAKAGKPLDIVKFWEPPAAEEEEGDEAAKAVEAEYGDIEEDWLMKTGRDLLMAAGSASRSATLQKAKGFLQKLEGAEERKIRQEIDKFGIDWTPGKGDGGKLVAELRTEPADGVVKAGEELKIIGRVTNKGAAPAAQVHAVTVSDNGLLDNRELVFGRLGPGESREWTIPVSVSKSASTRRDPLSLELWSGEAPSSAKVASVEVEVRALPRPQFAYAWKIDDAKEGNGDGVVQRGEIFELLVSVKNVGEGDAFKTRTYLKNGSGKGVYLKSGKQEQPKLLRGETAQNAFRVRLKDSLQGDQIELELSIVDMTLREYVTDTLHIPVVDKDSTARAPAPPGKAQLASLDVVPPVPTESLIWTVPPRIGVTADTEQTLLTHKATLSLAGAAVFDTSAEPRRYVYVFRNDKKVFFKSSPARADERVELAFDTAIPLEKGPNTITIFARSGSRSPTQRTLRVHRL